MQSVCLQVADIELIDLEIFTVENWYSTVGAPPISYVPYYTLLVLTACYTDSVTLVCV